MRESCLLLFIIIVGSFSAVGLVPWPSRECETDLDFVLIQTFFVFLWNEGGVLSKQNGHNAGYNSQYSFRFMGS